VQDFPPLTQGGGRKSIHKNNAARRVANINSEVPGAPAQGNNGFIPTRSRINMSFTTTTAANIAVHSSASLTAQQAREVQKRNPSGKFKAGHSNAPTGFTDVVVIRKGGVEDRQIEDSFRKRHPGDIAQAVTVGRP
jgi:predicted lipid-binding transport protein (Tim44 family)